MIKWNEESENSSRGVWGRDVCEVNVLFYFIFLVCV